MAGHGRIAEKEATCSGLPGRYVTTRTPVRLRVNPIDGVVDVGGATKRQGEPARRPEVVICLNPPKGMARVVRRRNGMVDLPPPVAGEPLAPVVAQQGAHMNAVVIESRLVHHVVHRDPDRIGPEGAEEVVPTS